MNTLTSHAGLRFGRLVVLKKAQSAVHGRSSKWLCFCDCGNAKVVGIDLLRSGNTRSCGCLHRELMSKHFTKHGQSHTPEYHAWHDMLRRCYNQKNKHYKDYGGRGIKVCQRWRDSFEEFFADMGHRPEGLTLERTNNELGYMPGNCEWATPLQQAHNRRDNNPLGMKGVTLTRSCTFQVTCKAKYIGTYKTLREAARAYDTAAIRLLGENARINGV